MRRSRWSSLAAFCVCLAIAAYDADSHAQTYPQDIHAHSRNTGPEGMTQHATGGINTFDSAAAFIQRKEEEDRERREIWERQRRMMENFANVPEQLRESYFRRQSGHVTR